MRITRVAKGTLGGNEKEDSGSNIRSSRLESQGGLVSEEVRFQQLVDF